MSNPKLYLTPREIASPVLFANATSTLPERRQPSWAELAHAIRVSHTLKEQTLRAREAYPLSSRTYAQHKRMLPAIAPAVARFDGSRSAEHAVALTGVALVDLDRLEPEALRLAAALLDGDPHTFLRHLTPSGRGLRVLVPFATDSPKVAYADAWEQCNQYVSLLTGHPADPATKDVCRLSFLCHDPSVHFNPHAKPLFVVPMQQEPQGQSPAVQTLRQLDDPFELAARLAQRSGLHFAPGGRHAFLVSMLCYLNKMGVPEQEAADRLARDYASYDEESMPRLARSVYGPYAGEHNTWRRRSKGYAAPFAPSATPSSCADTPPAPAAASADTKAGRYIANRLALRDFLLEHFSLRYNTVKDSVEILNKQTGRYDMLDNRALHTLYCECGYALPFSFANRQVDDVIFSEYVPSYNPFQLYLDGLPPYTPAATPDPISRFLSRLRLAHPQQTLPHHPAAPAPEQTDTPPEGQRLADCRTQQQLLEVCFRKWLVGMLAGWTRPEVSNEVVLVLIGGQGVGKTAFFEHLLPPALQQAYFQKDFNNGVMGKDERLGLAEFGLICFEELDGMEGRDLSRCKALLSAKNICERAAYARSKSRRSHVASFCATGNNAQFLSDLTGNRRWLPFEVATVARPEEEPVDYDALYAQALYLLKSGFQYWFSDEEERLLERYLEHFRSPNFLEDEIRLLYRTPREGETGHFVTNSHIADSLTPRLQRTVTSRAIGQMMRHLGFQPYSNGRQKGYIVASHSAATPSN